MDDLVVAGRLVVDPGAELHIVDGDGIEMTLAEEGSLDVLGLLAGHDGIEFEGLTIANTRFYAGSAYRHLAVKEGSIPVAEWDPQSTFEIREFSGGAYMASPRWQQTFGNVVYDCPDQGAFVEFNGLLGRIAGNLMVLNTNSNILKLLGSGDSLIVDGDIVIEGLSEVWFSETGHCSVSVGGDFLFRSTSTASSYFTTRGLADVTIHGDFVLDAVHRLKMASGTATGHTNLVLRGDAYLLNGKLDALGTGSALITFDGSQPRHVFSSPGTVAFDGNISYRIATGADLDLHQSLINNTTGGGLLVEGSLRLGSVSDTGMIQGGNDGNIQVSDSILFGEGSRVVFNGEQVQYIGYPHLNTEVLIMNPSGVALRGNVQLRSLTISEGRLAGESHTLALTGDLSADGPDMLEQEGILLLNGAGEQRVDIRGDTLRDIVIDQAVAGTVRLVSTLHLSGTLAIQSPGSVVVSAGYLDLLSTSEAAGATASIGRLPAGSAVTGAVTVHRFIQGAPGDNYRYISAPVTDASVASLMDDVVVTGPFPGADSVPGLPRGVPSLFYYDEQASRWEPYPVPGSSSDHLFVPGRGYCFFNWNDTADMDWDVTGVINQGPVSFDLTYTPTADPQLSGWNLVGNPYPATIQWGEEGWTSESVSPSIAVRDDLVGTFRYWDGQAGSLPSGLIASGQAFWVRTVGDNPSLQVGEDAKSPAGATYLRRRPADFLELTVKAGDQQDQAYLRLRKGSHANLDAFDAPKLRNDSLSVAFRTADDVDVAINAIPSLSCVDTFPLVIDFPGERQHLTFRIRAEGVVRASSFAITDTITGRRYNIGGDGSVVITGVVDLSSLKLLIESGVPAPMSVEATEVVCPGDSLVITLPRRREGVHYYLESEGQQFLPLAGSDPLKLYFNADFLPRGKNVYTVMGESACVGPLQIDSVIVVVHDSCTVDVFDSYDGEPQKGKMLAAFPVPCRDFLRITYPGEVSAVGLYTTGGMLVGNAGVRCGDDGCVVDLSGVAAGEYLVRVWDKSNCVTIRIVKTN